MVLKVTKKSERLLRVGRAGKRLSQLSKSRFFDAALFSNGLLLLGDSHQACTRILIGARNGMVSKTKSSDFAALLCSGFQETSLSYFSFV
jgi:hypothetical protein